MPVPGLAALRSALEFAAAAASQVDVQGDGDALGAAAVIVARTPGVGALHTAEQQN